MDSKRVLLGEYGECDGVVHQRREGVEGEERCVCGVRGTGGGAQHTIKNVVGGGEACQRNTPVVSSRGGALGSRTQ